MAASNAPSARPWSVGTPLADAALAEAYGDGDIIAVRVGADGCLDFSLDGQRSWLRAGLVLAAGKYCLCCQPYMGGAARLMPA